MTISFFISLYPTQISKGTKTEINRDTLYKTCLCLQDFFLNSSMCTFRGGPNMPVPMALYSLYSPNLGLGSTVENGIQLWPEETTLVAVLCSQNCTEYHILRWKAMHSFTEERRSEGRR